MAQVIEGVVMQYRHSAMIATLLGVFSILTAVAAEAPIVWVDEPEPDQRAEIGVSPVVSARVEPFCIRAGIDTYRMTVGVSDPDVVHVELSTNVLTYQGAPVSLVNLYDDGTHGDLAADDRIFTTDGLALASMTRTLGVAVLRNTTLTLVHSGGSRQPVVADLALVLHYISPTVPIPPAWSPAPDARRTTHAVGLVRPLNGTFPAHTIDFAAASRRYHELFPDDREFLIFGLPYNTAGSPGASFGLVKNAVSGLGLQIVDSSSTYGSDGILEGVLRTYWGNARFSGTLNHELLHRFASYLAPSLDLASPSGNNFNSKHWGAIERPSTGYASPVAYSGAFDHLAVGAGTGFEGWLDGNLIDATYNDLELYLMGLIGPEDVASPIRVLDNPSYQTDEVRGETRYSLYTAASLRSVTMADVIAANGLRQPGPMAAPRAFRTALVVPYDRALTDVELAYYDLAMREWEKPSSTVLDMTFFAATGGLATMTTMIPHAAGEAVALRVEKGSGEDVVLSWGSSCLPTDDDYVVYEGTLGEFASHVPATCTTGGLPTATLTSVLGSAYYLVVPRNAMREGSQGMRSDGLPRPIPASSCVPQESSACP